MIRRLRVEGGDAHVLGVVRVGVGLLSFGHALAAARALATEGFFGDRLHLPLLPAWALPSRSAWVAIVALRLLFAAMVTTGLGARFALAAGATLGVGAMLCDRLSWSEDQWLLALFAAILSLAPCDRAVSLALAPDASRHGPLWAQRLAQAQASIIIATLGAQKLFDADWRSGAVVSDVMTRWAAATGAHGALADLAAVVARPAVAGGLGKAIIASELFIAAGPWVPKTRVFALWWGLWFHALAAASFTAGTAPLTMLLALALFTTPDAAARKLWFDPSRPLGTIYARVVGVLDWLARFDIEPWAPDDLRGGHHLVVVRRDGARATGVRALAMVARCTPLLFPLWAPIALVASFTKHGEHSARS